MRRYDNSSLALFDPLRLIKRAIPDDMLLKVTEISPRLKDGGVFVKVQHDASVSPSEIEGLSRCASYPPLQSIYGHPRLTVVQKPCFRSWSGSR